MAKQVTKGHCYLCGSIIAKSGFRKHLSSKHSFVGKNAQECVLLRVEDTDTKTYWLYLDMPLTSRLKTLDNFLREIWLECCGHESTFFLSEGHEVEKSTELGVLPIGVTLAYEYDSGCTTDLQITVLSTSFRRRQNVAVRVLGRNVPLNFICGTCGEEAKYICCECNAMEQPPFFCSKCIEKHEHDCILPVVNSPRMGVCNYRGESDKYAFLGNANGHR